MVTGRSLLHVTQEKGKSYSFSMVRGYYNDLTNKVLMDKKNYDKVEVIKSSENGKAELLFPIAIFQYGLGSYDLYLNGNDKSLMKDKFLAQLDWCFTNQQADGSWKTFDFLYPESPYSAMAQGEGCSLLVRGFVETKDKKYLEAAQKAIDFMLISTENGGTTFYKNNEMIFLEFTNLPYVYNGWIFAIFGLLDYVIISNDEKYNRILKKAVESFTNHVEEMDNGYWSFYRHDSTISSPFYHHLHIALLDVLFEYSNNQQIYDICTKFKRYEKSFFKRTKAFLKKGFQKIAER